MSLIRHLRGFDLFFLAYLSSITFLALLVREDAPQWSSLIVRNLLIFAVWLLVVGMGEYRNKGFLLFLRNWYLYLFFPFMFTELKYLIHWVRPEDIDPILARIDYRIFGCHPSVWMERIVHPWITTFLQACYLLYFPFAIPLGAYLYARDREAFGPLVTTIGMGLFLTFVGYLIFPAIGPRFELASLHTVPLVGAHFTNALILKMNVAEGVCRDCFPSGHVAMVVMVFCYAYKKCRALLPLFGVVGFGIIMATVYLRYHYVVDVPAGILLGWFCLRAGPRFHWWWEEWAAGSASRKSPLVLAKTADFPAGE